MVLVSIPLRYMHMPAEVADEKDVEGCVELIAQFLANYKCVENKKRYLLVKMSKYRFFCILSCE